MQACFSEECSLVDAFVLLAYTIVPVVLISLLQWCGFDVQQRAQKTQATLTRRHMKQVLLQQSSCLVFWFRLDAKCRLCFGAPGSEGQNCVSRSVLQATHRQEFVCVLPAEATQCSLTFRSHVSEWLIVSGSSHLHFVIEICLRA